MKCGGEEENNHVHKCPLCSTQRDDIHALKYHIRKEHNKNKREIEDLIELGTETKKARRSPAPKNEPETDSTEKLTAVPNIKPPILSSTLVEDESHFLLSRTIIDQSESTTSKKPQVAQTATSTDIKKLPKTNCNEKCYVCFCGARFDESMSLAVHCHYVGHKFNDHIIQGKNSTKDIQQTSQRKKILVAKSEILCYGCPRASKHQDLSMFTEHIIKTHLQTATRPQSLRDRKSRSTNFLIESDIRRALQRFPPTMMDIINFRCLQCGKQEKNERELKKHIQKKHAEIPEFRCIFCPLNKPRFSGKREQMYQHINSAHANVRTNGETDKSLLDSCKVEDSLLWRCYGI